MNTPNVPQALDANTPNARAALLPLAAKFFEAHGFHAMALLAKIASKHPYLTFAPVAEYDVYDRLLDEVRERGRGVEIIRLAAVILQCLARHEDEAVAVEALTCWRSARSSSEGLEAQERAAACGMDVIRRAFAGRPGYYSGPVDDNYLIRCNGIR